MYYETPTNDKSAREQIDKVIQVSDRRYREHNVAINALKIQDAVRSDQIKTILKRLERLEKKNFTGPGKRV